jgi:hypothetical protein
MSLKIGPTKRKKETVNDKCRNGLGGKDEMEATPTPLAIEAKANNNGYKNRWRERLAH